MNKTLPLLASLFFLALPAAAAPAAPSELTGVASVIDGDTVEIHGERIRFQGIDAPESSQTCTRPDGKEWRCGQKAALALQEKIGKRPVTCTSEGRDKYKRLIGICRVGDVDLNGWLAENGWAVAYRKYSMAYVPQEEAAKAAKRNIWSGTFMLPPEFRAQKAERERVAALPKEGCLIKGNVSKSGNRVYHLPSSEWYEKTVINPHFGERWFCSEDEAKAAGWRPAQPSKEQGKKAAKPPARPPAKNSSGG